MTPHLKWELQTNRLCSQASQRFGLLRRNCYFVKDKRKARVLYLTMVRSIFQHCSIIWRPTTITLNEKVERIQKKAMKWILGEEGLSYSCNNLYLQKCKELKILPMKYRFELVDLLALHKIIHGISPVSLPVYLNFSVADQDYDSAILTTSVLYLIWCPIQLPHRLVLQMLLQIVFSIAATYYGTKYQLN